MIIADARQPLPSLSKHCVCHQAGQREISPGHWIPEIKTFQEDPHLATKQPLRALKALSSCVSGDELLSQITIVHGRMWRGNRQSPIFDVAALYKDEA
jgi:hypothetical protein